MSVPYAGATSGMKARDEITKTLQRFGCESVGFMDDFVDSSSTISCQFRRNILIRCIV